ncbi:MAG: cytochrome c-type biogenesis protein CcmH, partial [Gammaproteobacteria bacterium]|nr:cytochrome c-type biogenesis protein CcmH [Gammaproteobacteria bacterium]
LWFGPVVLLIITLSLLLFRVQRKKSQATLTVEQHQQAEKLLQGEQP